MNFSFDLDPAFSMSTDDDTSLSSEDVLSLVPSDEKPTSNDFENAVLNQSLYTSVSRCYREMHISADDYKRVTENRGEFCPLYVLGGGGQFTQWYFYHTLSGEKVFVFRTYIHTSKSYLFTWQYGQPKLPC